jgi:O-antigen ligase
MNFNILKIFSLLIYIYPLLLITGPFLPDLLVSISAIFYIYILLRDYKNIHYDKIFIFFIFFYTICIISSIFSENIIFSLKSSIPYIRHILFVYFIIYLTNKGYVSLKFFFYFFLISYTIIVLDGFYQYFFDVNLFGFPKSSSNRLSSFLNEEYVLGSYLVRMIPVLCGLILLQEHIIYKNKLIIINIYILISGVLILLSGERAALSLFILFAFILFASYKIDFYKKIISLIIIFIPIVLIILFNPLIKDRIVSQTYKTITSEIKIENFTDSQYRYHFKSGIEMFKDKILIGQGPKMYRLICKNKKYNINQYSCTTHPHNTYVQLLAEVGIIGFLVIISFLIYFLFILFKDFYYYYFKNILIQSNIKIMFISAILLNLWPFVTTGNFFNNWISMMYYFPLIFLLNKKILNNL